MFGAIEGDVDATHRIMHTALSGYTSDGPWDLTSLPAFSPKAAGKEPKSELGEEFAQWQCKDMDSCDGSACIFWHDERELRFAKVCAYQMFECSLVHGRGSTSSLCIVVFSLPVWHLI